MRYRINTGISFDHPDKGFLYYAPSAEAEQQVIADLDGWPDLDKLIREGSITAVDESSDAQIAVLPPEPDPLLDTPSPDVAPARRGFRRSSDKEI